MRARRWAESRSRPSQAVHHGGQHRGERPDSDDPRVARPEVVSLPCEVCPVLAVVGVVGAFVAGVLELDVDEDDALVVGAVDAGADGGLRFPD